MAYTSSVSTFAWKRLARSSSVVRLARRSLGTSTASEHTYSSVSSRRARFLGISVATSPPEGAGSGGGGALLGPATGGAGGSVIVIGMGVRDGCVMGSVPELETMWWALTRFWTRRNLTKMSATCEKDRVERALATDGVASKSPAAAPAFPPLASPPFCKGVDTTRFCCLVPFERAKSGILLCRFGEIMDATALRGEMYGKALFEGETGGVDACVAVCVVVAMP